MKRFILTLALCALMGVTYAAPQYTITDLGTLGGNSSAAVDLNNLGQVVGYSTFGSSSAYHPFLWSISSGMQDLGTFGGLIGTALGINDNGKVVGRADSAAGITNAFLWDSTNGMQTIGTLGGPSGEAQDINNSGIIVGAASIATEGGNRAFIWDSANGMQQLPTPTTVASGALAISDNGYIAGSYCPALPCTGATVQTATWDSNGFIQSFGQGSATDVNNSGTFVGAKPGPDGAFRWSQASGYETLLGLGGINATANDINDLGWVVGGAHRPDGGLSAMIWAPDGVGTDLNLLVTRFGWNSLETAAAINDLGQIVGWGRTADNQDHAFLLTPVAVPIPAAAWLFGSAIGLLIIARKNI